MAAKQESRSVDDRTRNRKRLADERRRKNERNKRIAIGLAALVVAGIVGLFAWNIYQGERDEDLLGSVQEFDVASGHVSEPVTYAQTPPAGGEHFTAWQNCGYYAVPIQNEFAVHSLEHGAVWITYRPDLPAEQIETLRRKAEQTYVLVSPYEGLPVPVVASAWGLQLQLDSADDEALDAFLRQYRQGPQTPEPGAACTGGIADTQ